MQAQPTSFSEYASYPGFLRRMSAIVYDGLLLVGLLFAATALILPFNGGEAIRSGQWLFSGYLVLVTYLFFGWFWTHGGQTLGMRAWNIRLVSRSGGPVTWRQSLIRFCCAIVSFVAAGLGYWWILFNREHEGWHDRLSRSRIVRVDHIK